ncbi:hypothetical protein [Burkholderia sp. TSV86]|uniref:hypothetical protein n=1 Tax=Burkholderia sp. TSV86 TaxID=1385594 RepID=UPI000AF3AA55|nr:hypothetical protein [Burkholderia sp. TSV86]
MVRSSAESGCGPRSANCSEAGSDSRPRFGSHAADAPPTPAPRSTPSPLPADDATAALPDAGALISVRGVARIVTLTPNEQACASLWRQLMRWRECAGR